MFEKEITGVHDEGKLQFQERNTNKKLQFLFSKQHHVITRKANNNLVENPDVFKI